MVKTFENLLQDQSTDGLDTLYVASGSSILSRLFKIYLHTFLDKVKYAKTYARTKISLTSLKVLVQDYSDYDLRLTSTFYGIFYLVSLYFQ